MILNKTNSSLETAAIQIVSVFAWLWAVPVIDSLDSYTYGMATRAIIISFIPFVIGVVAASAFPNFISPIKSRWALIIGCLLLTISLVFYVIIHQEIYIGWWFYRSIALLRIFGFTLLGYGLQAMYSNQKWTFKAGLAMLIILYTSYNLLIWGMNNVPCQYMPLYRLANIAYALVRIAIVVALWKTLSANSVTNLISRFPKCSILVAGLFWGMFLVIPADRYSPRWLAILMLCLAPLLAYINTVLIRFSVKLIGWVFKGIVSNRGWWKEICLLWKK